MAQNDGMRGPSAHPEYDDGGWQYYEPGVSDTLRHVRESQELELRDVSKELRIRYDYLLAIEEARYHDLPGTTYAIGFVRSYADYLGLDSDDMVQRFKAEVRDLAAAEQNLSFPAPKPEGRIPGVALVLISVLLIALVYGAWYFWDDQGRPYVELLPGVSEEEGLGAEDGVDSAVSNEDDLATTQDFEDGADDTGLSAADSQETQDADEDTQEGLESENEVSPAAETGESEVPVGDGTEIDATATANQDEAGESESAVPSTPDSLTEADRDESAIQEPAQDPTETADLATDTQTDDFSTETQDETIVLGTDQDIPDMPEDEASPAEAESSEQEADGTIPDLPGSEEETDEDTPAETGPGRVYGEDNEGARIVLEATSDSWVQVRDAGGELVFTRVLRAGESYLVPDEEGMTLLTGNAGGLDIRVDGDTIPSLGGMGTVRRDVPLDPQQLSSGDLQQ